MECREALERGVAALAVSQSDLAQEIAATVEQLQGLDNVGIFSSIDMLLREERFAGKGASVDFIKTNPACTEADAEAAWSKAAKAATGLPALLVPVPSYAWLYRANLGRAGMIPEATWEAQRAWIIATDRAVIMGA